MDVSIIIVSYNTKELTKNCIHSVFSKTEGLEYDVFVVDNCSGDGSADMIAEVFPSVKLIRNSDNIGFGAANNVGIQQSNAKYVFLLNSDTILINNAIKMLYDFMELAVNDDVACCGGALYNKDLTNQISFGRFPEISGIFYYYLLSKVCKKTFETKYSMAGIVDSESEIAVDYVTGADMMIRHDLLSKYGGFDPDFFLFFEETELCSRFIKNGFRNMIFPQAKIVHLCGMSPISEQKEIIFERSRYLFLSKHKNSFYSYSYKAVALTFKFLASIVKKIFNHG